MKILFVSGGNNGDFRIAPFIKSQGDSLSNNGISLAYYSIRGKGLLGYLRNIFPLRKRIKQGHYDVIHSHYSLCGWVSALTLTTGLPKLVSYMGCDVYGDYDKDGKLMPSSVMNIISARILQFFVKRIIVKSPNLKHYIHLKNKVHVLPNGVDIHVFRPSSRTEARAHLGLDPDKQYVLFLGEKANLRKNYHLLEEAFAFVRQDVELVAPYPVPYTMIAAYLNACDVLAVTSYQEGSPNIIKEAMACNIPIVSTDVGDVKWVLGDTEGCYITPFEAGEVAAKLSEALRYAKLEGKTRGRDRIIELGLDTDTIAAKLIKIYHGLVNKKQSVLLMGQE